MVRIVETEGVAPGDYEREDPGQDAVQETSVELSSAQIADFVSHLGLVAETMRSDSFLHNALLANKTDQLRSFWEAVLIKRGDHELIEKPSSPAGAKQIFPHP